MADELERLTREWGDGQQGAGDGDVLVETMGATRAAALDRFDAVQLAAVIRAGRRSRSLSEAGRLLFSESRKAKKVANDADRLRRYLACFGLAWARVGGGGSLVLTVTSS